MSGYSTYLTTITKASVKSARSNKKHTKEFNEIFKNQLFNLDGPTRLERNLTDKEVVISKLFYGFNEVHKSYQRLKDLEIYINSFPYSKTSLSKVNHLNYNVENYLNELYILKERIKAYLTTVGRIYRNDKQHSKLLQHTRLMFKAVPSVFGDLIEARCSHVHQSRYTDTEFDRLTTIELLTVHGDNEELKILESLYVMGYKDLRKKWKDTITNNNKSLLEVLDIIFKALHPYVFTKTGNIKFPRANKNV